MGTHQITLTCMGSQGDFNDYPITDGFVKKIKKTSHKHHWIFPS